MIKAKCIRKNRNKQGNIIGYELIDEQGKLGYFEADALKRNILSNNIDVINLKLTSDNKLVDKKEDISDIIKKAKNSAEARENILVKRYGRVLEDIGVDIVGAFYIPYGLKYLRDNAIIESDMKVDGVEITLRQLLENPESFVGRFDDYGGGIKELATRSLTGDFFVRIPILILHKDNIIRIIMFYELDYVNEIQFMSGVLPTTPEEVFCKRELKKNSDARYPQPLTPTRDATDRRGYKLATMTSKGKIARIDLESYITKGESKKLGKLLVDSDIHYWLSEYTYNNIFKTAYSNAYKYSEYRDILERAKSITSDLSLYGSIVVGMLVFVPGLFFAFLGFTVAMIPTSFLMGYIEDNAGKIRKRLGLEE